jgi:hypothetical protein
VEPAPGGRFSWFNGHVLVRRMCAGGRCDVVARAGSNHSCARVRVCVCVTADLRAHAYVCVCCVWPPACTQGTFEELEPGRRIVMAWRFNNWDEDCLSKV